MDHVRRALGPLGLGNGHDAGGAQGPEHAQVKIVRMRSGRAVTVLPGDHQVIVGELEAARPPSDQPLTSPVLERVRPMGDVPHGPPLLGHVGQRIGEHEGVGRESSASLAQDAGRVLQASARRLEDADVGRASDVGDPRPDHRRRRSWTSPGDP